MIGKKQEIRPTLDIDNRLNSRSLPVLPSDGEANTALPADCP